MNRSFAKAVSEGIERASKTVHNIKSAWVKSQSVVVQDGKIDRYRVDLKVTFILD